MKGKIRCTSIKCLQIIIEKVVTYKNGQINIFNIQKESKA